VWSRCVSARGTVKSRLGDVNVPVVCARRKIEAGDVVIGDDDGVVTVRRASRAVLAAAKQRETRGEVARALPAR